MIVPVLGIIIFQSYWLIRTFQVNKERFEKDIHICLQDALETDITSQTAANIPQLDSAFNGSIDISSDLYPGGDSEIEELMNLLSADDSISSDQITIHFAGIEKDSIVSNILPFHEFTDSLNIYGDTIITLGSPQSMNVSQSWKDVLLKIVADIVGYQTSLSTIDSIYAQKLMERGISSSFDLALLQNGETIESTSNGHSDFDSFDARISVDKLMSQSSEIRAVFPQKNSYVLLSMWVSLLSSFLLTVAVVGTFFYMLLIIFRQKKLSDMKNDFISNMTHEFKTPIATVSAAIEAMQHFGALDDKSKTESYLNISKKELQRLNSMVEKVLDISAYEKNKMVLNKEEVYLSDLLEDISERFRLQKPEVHIILEAHKNICIWGDRLHIGNLVNNLLDNAVKYCQQKAHIQIKLNLKSNMAHLSVKDNGIGISKEHQQLIFDKFYRVPGEHLHRVKGFGLGLSYVKHVVDEHQGLLHIKSKAGEGSEFIIQIPLYESSK